MVEKKIITDLNGDEICCQQNGVDLTLQEVFLVSGSGELFKDGKKLPEYIKAKHYTSLTAERPFFWFERDCTYSLLFHQYIKLPKDVAALIIHRSSLLRMGGRITSGLYDSGFENQIGAFLYSTNSLRIEKGTRIAQIIFFKAESNSLYEGQYQIGT